jgi:hypothetical protein
VLPKKSFLTAYSYRCDRPQQRALLAGWVAGLSGLRFDRADTFSLDFHPIPFRGEAAGLERHYIPLAGKASPSVLSCFALEHDRRVLCYANAGRPGDEDSHGCPPFSPSSFPPVCPSSPANQLSRNATFFSMGSRLTCRRLAGKSGSA